MVVLSKWFPRTGRGILLGFWASNCSVGDIVGTTIYQKFSTDDDLSTPFIIVAGLVFTVGLINMLFLIESPKDANIDFTEEQSTTESELSEYKEQNSKKEKIGFLKALTMPGILIFASSFFFIKLTCEGIYYWYPTYLQEHMDLSKDTALDIFKIFSTGAFAGNIFMGCVSDVLPMRSPIFELGILISTAMLYLVNHSDQS